MPFLCNFPHFFLKFLTIFLNQLSKVTIIPLQQIIRCIKFSNIPLIHHQNLIIRYNRIQPMSNRYYSR